ncbi:hypothetical protein LJR230_000298 [Trinickia sp. LjRoot230]|uniref:hypothetical protein n=1 Tax=Trinickia sp. LjRoot230 TaxID=3342288 RepID=UPI003ECEAEE8
MNTSSGSAATATSVTGTVTEFRFGDSANAGTIQFKVTDSDKTVHSGTMTTNIDNMSSTGFAIVFIRAMASGYQVTVSSANGTTYDGVTLLSPV